MKFNAIKGEFMQEELKKYEEYAKEKEPNCVEIDIELDNEFVNLIYHIKKPFERITGYLVGTIGKWNSSKNAELNSRVKYN